MAKTKIEFATYTFNPWIGGTKVAVGTRVKTSETYWRQPLKWNRKAEKADERPRVFCASLADLFEDWQGWIHDHSGKLLKKPFGSGATNVTMDDLRRDLFALIDATPHLNWLLLTKHPENVRRMWPMEPTGRRDFPRQNVWLGCSVSDQATADESIPELLKCRDLSPVLFLSCEPLLGPIDLGLDAWWHLDYDGGCSASELIGAVRTGELIRWAIVGGESGPMARPCNIEWIRSIRDQCKAAGVRVFCKQLGSVLSRARSVYLIARAAILLIGQMTSK